MSKSMDPEDKGRARAAAFRRKTVLPGQRAAPADPGDAERKARLAFRDTEAKLDRIRGEEVQVQKRQAAMPWDVSDEEAQLLQGVEKERSVERTSPKVRPLVRIIGVAATVILFVSVSILVLSAMQRRGAIGRLLRGEPDVKQTLYYQFSVEKAEEFFDNYFAAPTWEARLAFVRHPEQTRPLMAEYYSRNPLEERPVKGKTRIGTLWNHDKEFALAVVPGVFREEHIHFAFEPTPEGLKLDWESMVGYSEMPVSRVLEERIAEPKLARVRMEPHDYYNYEFGDRSVWACFRIEERGEDRWFYGYVRRDSADYRELQAALDDTTLKVLYPTVRVRVPPGNPGDNQVEISEVVNRHWLIP